MRKAAYITLGISIILFVTLFILWVSGWLFASSSVGGLIHLLLLATVFPILGIVIGVILLIISFVKK